MRRVGEALRAAGVGAIYLVHGTFAGTDALGLIRGVTRFTPGARGPLERQTKRLVDAVIRETGNYASQFATHFEDSIAHQTSQRIPVQLFHWTSENHHVGRADAAVRLVEELSAYAATHPQIGRLLIWGHSHGGNVLALVTNLLAADEGTREAFFSAARTFYRTPCFGKVDVSIWQRVRAALEAKQRALDGVPLDIVTFGTPIRYGWDTDGYGKLLHFVHHRAAEGLPPYRAPFPPKVRDVLWATHGDMIQQLGIAGTNVSPGILAWRAWLANRRLARLLHSDLRPRDLIRNYSCGLRVPDEGTTLLVDYRNAAGRPETKIAGHAVYTRRDWLLFHAEEVCRRFYESME
jgi:hypothetical protein